MMDAVGELVRSQGYLFLTALLLGAALCFVYDLFRVFRRVVPHNLQAVTLEDFLFCRPKLEEDFWSDRHLVYGHTPTRLLRAQMGQAQSDDILCWRRQIAIDCGCGFGGKLGCLCLDTMETFYVE